MSIADYPEMIFSERRGWRELDRQHHTRRWFQTRLVWPLSALPPIMWAYAERNHPGEILPMTVPALDTVQLAVSMVVFYGAQVAMIGFMAMMIQRMAIARDHDPGADGAYALAAVAPVPLWLGSLALLVPSFAVNIAVLLLAWAASILLIRHGVRPLLHVSDPRKAHYIAEVVTLAGVAAWIGLLLVSALVLSLALGVRAI